MSNIDKFLEEVAMESHDGLSSGWTDENISLLTKKLEERGMTQDEVLEIITPMIDEAQPRTGKKPEDKGNDAGRDGDPYPEKRFSPVEVAFSLQELIKKNSRKPEWQEFVQNYNKASNIKEAMNLYNKTGPDVIAQLNDIKTSQSRAALGKGELPIVWFLRGSRHGGGETGDIIFGNEIIDAKEIGVGSKKSPDKGNIGIERNSFEGFNQNKFISDLSDLINILRDENVRDYIKKNILNTPEAQSKLSTGKRGEIAMTNQFLDSFDMGKFGKNTIAGINYIGNKVKELKNSPDKGTTVVSVFSHGEKHTAAVNNPEKVIDTLKQVENPSNSANVVAKTPLEIKPVDKEDPTIAISKLLRARFFHTQWTEEDMWKELSKSLHYTGIVVISYGGGKALEYVPKKDFVNRFSFRGISKGITISYPKQTDASGEGSDETSLT